MKNLFNSVKMTRPTSSNFDLTHDVKQTSKMGELTPCLVMECVPGDKFSIGADTLIRFAPLIAPVMHRMDATIHYFFVPNRIIWPNWEKFITENNPPINPPVMNFNAGMSADEKRFSEYMGIPKYTGINGNQLNALPFAAYQKIYNEYYRDQNLIQPVPDTLIDGLNNVSDYAKMRLRAYEHDYFTSALPFAQKGAAVDIPIGDVKLRDDYQDLTSTPFFISQSGAIVDGDVSQNTSENIEIGAVEKQFYNPNDSLTVDATTINDLRRAFKLQEWLEKNARAGTRYIESILGHFGVRSSDKRLQRPEYITGVKSPVVISEVLNSTGEEGGLPQGNMAGHAISVNGGKTGSYTCEEHGFIIGIVSVIPKTAYYGGVPKQYLKTDPLDYYWPSFAHLGEQEISTFEVNANAPNDTPFGYTPRYSEYKYMPSRIAGDFTTSLDFWHLGKILDNDSGQTPLNKDFIEVKPDQQNRIFAVQSTEDYLYMHILHRIKAYRPMPKFGTPSF